jgi:hypothetical protein
MVAGFLLRGMVDVVEMYMRSRGNRRCPAKKRGAIGIVDAHVPGTK